MNTVEQEHMPGNYGTSRSSRGRWLASFASCTLAAIAGGGACMGGDMQIAVPKSTARVLAIGPIENRDARYSPFTTQNFVDMLDFELVRLGYDTLRARDLESSAKDEDSEKPRKKSQEDSKKKSQQSETQSEKSDSSEEKSPEATEDSGTADPAATEEQPGPGTESETPGALEGEALPADEQQEQAAPADEARPTPENETENETGNEIEGETEDATPPADDADPTGDDDGAPVVRARFFPAGGGPRGGLLEYLAQAPSGDKQRASDSVSDLLPDYLQDVAGQKPPAEIAAEGALTKRRRQYSKQEIAEFFEEHPADFFLQGSIGRTESGDLLDSEQNTLIFLEIYGRTGERIGVVSFLIRGETLAAPDILRDVCEEVVEEISLQVLK